MSQCSAANVSVTVTFRLSAQLSPCSKPCLTSNVCISEPEMMRFSFTDNETKAIRKMKSSRYGNASVNVAHSAKNK